MPNTVRVTVCTPSQQARVILASTAVQNIWSPITRERPSPTQHEARDTDSHTCRKAHLQKGQDPQCPRARNQQPVITTTKEATQIQPAPSLLHPVRPTTGSHILI
jgi:hypothetical protein